ncbi:hypothetical protein ABPG75_008495 [Micractinium tetrahymenae]
MNGGSGGGPAWRERWLLTVLRLDKGGATPAARHARATGAVAGTSVLQEKQRLEVDFVGVLDDGSEQQKRPAEPQQQLAGGLTAEQLPPAAPPTDAQRLQKWPQHCAIYNGVRFHSDVAAGMAWAFQEAGCEVSTYFHPEMLGMQRVMAPWFRGRHRDHKQLLADAAQYDAIVMVTFPEHRFMTQLSLLLGQHRPPPHQRLLLVTHNPGRLLDSCTVGSQEWLLDLLAEQAAEWGTAGGKAAGGAAGDAAGAAAAANGAQRAAGPATASSPRMQLLTLAPCVSNFTAAMLETWAAAWQTSSSSGGGVGGSSLSSSTGSSRPRAEVPWIAPLVPWAPHAVDWGREVATPERLQHLCIQGSIHPKRRDYAGAFAAAAHPAVLAQLRASNESLLLVGADTGAELDVPAALRPFVRILSGLRFQDYYRTLSSCRAILTAFGSDEYIVNKTSSTLAAALQVGAPVLTEDSVLAGYPYVSPEAAYSYRRGAASGPVPDPASLGAEAGGRVAALTKQEWHALRLRCKRGAAAAGRRRLHEAGQTGAGDTLAAASSTAGGNTADGSAADALPPPGSYAAALLAAFDDEANRAAHDAAWRAKQEVMQHNVQVAKQLLAA